MYWRVFSRRRLSRIAMLPLVLMGWFGEVHAREDNPKIALWHKQAPRLSTQAPIVDYTAHNRGNIQLAIANNGTFGTLGSSIADPFTGEAIPSCIYPKNSDLVYLWVAAIWIGAVVGRDTLVSVGNEDWYRTTEFWPDFDFSRGGAKPPGGFTYRSIDINSRFHSSDALSEQDIICEYTDTLDNPAIVQSDPVDNRPHIPLGIKVYQRSMAWSFSYAEDFILFDYQVENIGQKQLNNVYMGIYVDGDVWHTTRQGPDGWNDDLVGFYRTHPAPEGCGFTDTINVAYHADNDGDPVGGAWNEASAPHAVGVRVVRTPAEELNYSYNWWIINYGNAARDFGPRRAGTPDDPYRSFGARLGTPEGDKNKYYILRHKEFDYDLLFTAVDQTHQGWLAPPENAEDYARGFDCRYLLSFGPFDISPGQRLPISFAWLGGADLHSHPNNFSQLFAPKTPAPFYNSFDFSDLAANSRWASWVYDNPGVDTDDDGYAGEFRVCQLDSSVETADTLISGTDTTITVTWEYTVAETTWYRGDGVPDFKGAGPPPAPRLRVVPSDGRLVVRWNGYYSESTPDQFLGNLDFEGYRVYIGRDDRPQSFSLLASYDRENYNRYVFRETGERMGQWVLEEAPFTIDSLRQEYDDPDFQPLRYTRSSPLVFGGVSYYFEPQDYNASDLTRASGIHKVYPEAPHPGLDSARWRPEDLVHDYGEPLPKYFEYELVVDDLLPTVPYYVAVTAMDFGSPAADLPPLETDPTNNMVIAYPQYNADSVAHKQLDVYVYPNPYITDSYRHLGFEGRNEPNRPDHRVRALHFANLPHKCKISIFSIDGDLVAEINHEKDPSDPQSAHNQWDLITRNTQEVVSGLYYYVVEGEDRVQIDKFVIIR